MVQDGQVVRIDKQQKRHATTLNINFETHAAFVLNDWSIAPEKKMSLIEYWPKQDDVEANQLYVEIIWWLQRAKKCGDLNEVQFGKCFRRKAMTLTDIRKFR